MLDLRKIMHKHKLLTIVLAAFLTVTALSVLVRLKWFAGWSPKIITVAEQNGIYDLTGLEDLNGTVISLAPSTFYYPNIYLTPKNANAIVPESIYRYDELKADYLSQRFLLTLPDNTSSYTMTFTLSGRHALRVYVNGRLAAQTGHMGTSKQDTEVWENNITFNAVAVNGKMEIILNSAQFYHAKGGASLATLRLNKDGGMDISDLNRIEGLLVMGALLSAAVILLGIYSFLSRTKETLYFAIAILIMMLRECLQSQVWTYFPISGNLSFMLEYLSVVLLTVFLSLYLGQYVTGGFVRGVQYMAIIGSFAYGVCVLFGDSLFYTSVLGYYQVLLVLTIVPGISMLFWTMRIPTREQTAALYGIAVFFLAAVLDIVMYSDLLGDGTNAPLSEMAMLVFVLAQTVSLFMMNNRVLAEVKEMEQKLIAEKESLENLNRMKTEFLGNISHELKTPLTVMSGYAQTTRQLAEGPGELDGGEVSRRMKLISSEAERLSLMVGQVLDVTCMEEGRMAVEKHFCHIDEIIHSAVETHYPLLNKNSNRLEIHIEPGLPAINADPARISQVIVNLISNAVRFTTNGLITLSAKREDKNIVVCAADTGTGISTDRLPHLFERYNHKEKTGGGQDTGTGLGLYICRHIVEQHGGKIWIESREGKETSVFFTLPIL